MSLSLPTVDDEVIGMNLLGILMLVFTLLLYTTSAALAGAIMSNTAYETPLVILGDGSAPVAMVLGGVHGNEPAGSLAAQQLTQAKVLKGTLIIVPQVNKLALDKNIRTLDSIGDINRQYNEQQTNMPSKQIAKQIIEIMKKHHVSMLIDLHEARTFHKQDNSSLGQLILPTMNDKSAMLALDAVEHINKTIEKGYKQFGYGPYPLPDSAAYYAGKTLKITAFTLETSSQNELSERVRQHYIITKYLLAAEGVVLE